MAEYQDAVYGVAYNFAIGLIQQADTKLLKAGATIASGDFKISKDFGALANLATLPDAEPDGGRQVRVQLSATEMQADNIGIECVDAAGAEWCDQFINIQTKSVGLATVAAYIDTEIAAIKTKTDSLTFTNANKVDATVRSMDANIMTASALATDAVTEIVAALLNTVNTGATYNVANSVGAQIRRASGGGISIRTGTAQAGSTTSTIKLDAAASATNNLYQGGRIVITGGTGVGQQRTIVAYSGSTKVATVDKNWVTTPDATSTFEIVVGSGSITSHEGTAQAGGATTITLASTANATNSYYVPSLVTILSGTGSGQTREITGYVGATKVATVDSAWSVNPDNTSVYAVIPSGGTVSDLQSAPTVDQIVGGLMARSLTQRDASALLTSTVEDALSAARAQGAGAWTLVGTTLTLKNPDGTTFRSFTLDSATAPTTRT